MNKFVLMLALFSLAGCIEVEMIDGQADRVKPYKIKDTTGATFLINEETGEVWRLVMPRNDDGDLITSLWQPVRKFGTQSEVYNHLQALGAYDTKEDE